MKIKTYIKRFNPCGKSRAFLRQFDTFQEAWNACPRGDWMLSAAKLLEVDVRTLTLAKGLCTNTVRHLMKDPRSIDAVCAATSFSRGEISEEELHKAHVAAAHAADAKKANQQQTADICREILTEAVFAALETAEKEKMTKTEKELLIELNCELENFNRRLKQRMAEINACKNAQSTPSHSRLRGELRHRAVIVRNLLAEYRKGNK